MEVWGTGKARREFLHVDDLADACLFLMQSSWDSFLNEQGLPLINVGYGDDITIKELAGLIADLLEYKGSIDWNLTKPDGTPQKLLDITIMTSMGWRRRIELKKGLAEVIDNYQKRSVYEKKLKHR